jgi:hypothetical protein
MDANDRMNALDVFRASTSVITVKVRMRTAVNCLSTIYDLSEGWRKLFIGGVA